MSLLKGNVRAHLSEILELLKKIADLILHVLIEVCNVPSFEKQQQKKRDSRSFSSAV